MKKNILFLAIMCVTFCLKAQQVTNNPSQMYTLGYDIGKEEYTILSTVPTGGSLTQAQQDRIDILRDKKEIIYDRIMETYHSAPTANAFIDGYLNGLMNSGNRTRPGSSYAYTAPPSGSSLNNKINYDASILFPTGVTNHNNLTVFVYYVGGKSDHMVITFEYNASGWLIITVTYK